MTKFFLAILLFFSLKIFAIDGILIKTIDYSFNEKWNNTLGSSIPKISTCEKVFKGQYFYLTAIASDYKLDENQLANVVYSIKIKKPDNSIYYSTKDDLPLINSKIENPNNLQMSNAVLKKSFEKDDRFGKYEIEIVIKDLNSKRSKTLSSEISLVEIPSFNDYKIKDDNEFANWFSNYYQNPKPEEALANYIYFSKSKIADKDSSFWPAFSFFKEIFESNQFLSSEIIKQYEQEELKTKIYLLYLLEYSKVENEEFFTKLIGDEKETYLKIKNSPMKNIYGEIDSPEQLDMLWGTFMANGSYKTLHKLIQTLDYSKYVGELDKFKSSKQKTDEKKGKAIKNLIYDSLVWSLQSNIKQHELVLNYCNWAYTYEELNIVQKAELGKILGK